MGRRFKEQGPGPKSTSLPIAANARYREALHVIAMRRGIKLNQMVFDIIDAAFGEEVAEVQALFFANNGSEMSQSANHMDEGDNEQA